MDYCEFKPHPLLSDYVECYWYAYSERPPFRERETLIPDGTIELMFNFGENYFRFTGAGGTDRSEIKGSHIIGIRRRALTISQPGKQHFFCIRFRLGGTYPFFKLPVHLFAGDFFSLDELFGRGLGELEERLYLSKDNAGRVEITNQFLLGKLRPGDEEFLFARRCVPELLRSGNIGRFVKDHRITYKTLERRFRKVLGLSPSEVIKINRFNNAVLTMYSCRYDSLTRVAYASGYYDQSHFIREFRHLTGFRPKDFLREQFTIVQVIQPALAERMSKSYNF